MTDDRRDPQSDNELIDDPDGTPLPSQSGSSGGSMQRDIGARDDDKAATGADPQPTSVHKSDKANQGDEPNLPNRDGPGAANDDRAPPRQT